MDLVLRPGMAVVRRIRTGAKFALFAALTGTVVLADVVAARTVMTALVAAVFYMLASMWRATVLDVGVVLDGIAALTSDTVDRREPLHGPDEFAAMSRQVVHAHDHLTALLGSLRFTATQDELTSLGNRAFFAEKLALALEGGTGDVVVVLVDLDGFTDVNDSFGHDIGDRLLREVGVRFHRAVRRHGVLARIAGDEFAVLLRATDRDETERIVAELRAVLERPVVVDGRRLHVRACFGVVQAAPGSASVVEVLRDADLALSAAKAEGKNRLAWFRPQMRERTRERTVLSGDLVGAVEGGQLDLLYQPIVDMRTDRVHGVEALVRWRHPTRGLVPPAEFVPLAEAVGLIDEIGTWVLRTAMTQLAGWQHRFGPGHRVTMEVNLSPEQLRDPDLVGHVLELVDATGVQAADLVLEITESALVQDVGTALRRLARLRTAGIRLALDDFGTGYSSLSHLATLPVEILKIDKSFADDLGTTRGHRLYEGIVDLARRLDMQTVAEGVETQAQRSMIRDAGCDLGQGYLWSRPLPADQVTALLARGRSLSRTSGSPYVFSG